MMESQIPALIALTLALFAIIVPAFGLKNENYAQPLAVIGAGVASLFSLVGLINFLNSGEAIRYSFGGWTAPVGVEFLYDGIAAFFVLVINSVAFFVLIYSLHVSEKDLSGRKAAYYALTMLMMLGFNGIVLTGDLFTLFVFLEISSLASYGLLAIGDKPAPYSAYRYLIIGTIGGSLYLLGIGFLYTVTGTLNIIDMSGMLPQLFENNAVFGAIILMVVGIAVKAALFPMHGWLPDAYTFSTSSSTALIAPIGTKIGAYTLFRIVFWLFGLDIVNFFAPVTYTLGLLACIGILYGSIMAIAQTEFKKMLAYSSVSQIGYIIMGLSLANPWGFAGALLHVLNHSVMKAALFMVSGYLRMKEGHSDIRHFNDTYRKKYPWMMAFFTLAAISMVGLPPLAGFFSKWYLALGSVNNSNWLFLTVILTSTLLNAVYFFRILERVYMKNPDQAGDTNGEIAVQEYTLDPTPASVLIPTGILAIGLLVIGLTNAIIVGFILNIAPFG